MSQEPTDNLDPIQNNCKYGYVLPDRCRYNNRLGCDCGAYKGSLAMTITGELRDWEYDHMYNVYFGNIFCDRKRRWIDGKRIRTSSVLAVVDGEDHLLVVTLNSTYKLNKNQQMGKTHGCQVRQSPSSDGKTPRREDSQTGLSR